MYLLNMDKIMNDDDTNVKDNLVEIRLGKGKARL